MKSVINTTINVKDFSSHFAASIQCKEGYKESHLDAIEEICKALPNGSGIDSGVTFDSDNSTPEKLVFTFGFHHMNENGYYDGWTDHKLIITPSLQFGFNIKITGRDRNQIKEYLYDLFSTVFE